MNVRIYKINTGITGRNFSSDKRSNFPIGGKTNSFYSIGNLMRGIEDFYLEGNLYFIDKEEELEKFYNPLGDRWVAKKKYYISHPKKERENYLLEASKFHEYIVREQLEEIANYLHHELNINSLKIEVEDGNDFSFYTNIAIEEMNLNDEGKVELKGDKTLEIKWSENVNSQNEFLWIEDFEGLVNKVQELKSSNKRGEDVGSEENSLGERGISYILEIDNSFGISEKIGKKIGVNHTWLKKCSFKLVF
ncbi:hypothetical protein ACSW8X_16980 (plasmid) [Clostridium perfringens]|uniref:Uncharacterized protein n=1 Tax=Clostridium perfringens E str. JGS1987 TaxID=451755 RepID=B1BQ81_CLOPF|nr:hypothetical protein [Clostridium perfringens]EDT16203.1 conserved hypothetical protein [Clostridium perfringens E str. JGS1987]EJT6557372.1 hypothetical protein [Clostridium perfringens]ELC8459372.1 hypothetical protein [Clostridium perfringens]MCX0376838.1 hypothetical protein [Clostridium perfringens]HAT4301200.1 hypothetical protein [Clostridium perfringens]